MKPNTFLYQLLSILFTVIFSLTANPLTAQEGPPPFSIGSKFAADFNGDGIGDIAIGVPNENIGFIQDAGAVQVLYGSTDFCSTTIFDQLWHQNSPGIFGDSEEGDNFGASLAVGDFNKDGFDDLAIGVPRESREYVIEFGTGGVLNARIAFIGMVHILYGSTNGLSAQNSQYRDWSIFPNMLYQSNSFMGKALISGDFDKDGYDDLAIGAPLLDPLSQNFPFSGNQGAIFTLYGSNNGLSTKYQLTWTQSPLLDATGFNDQFGSSLASGDFNRDGYDDLAVGAPFDNITGVAGGGAIAAGLVNIIYGSSTGLTAVNNQVWHQNSPQVPGQIENHDHFGKSLTVGDFNSDGHTDLAIGVPDEDIGNIQNAGAVHVIFGSSSGLRGTGSEIWHQNSPGIVGTSYANDNFGQALSSGDLNSDAYSDLIVGVPNENVGGFENAGVINILFGGSGGLTSVGDQIWHQDTQGLSRGTEANDQFGFAISTVDFNGDNRSDMFVGTPGESYSAISSAGGLLALFGESGIFRGESHLFLQQNSPRIDDAAESRDNFGKSISIGKYIQGIGASGLVQQNAELLLGKVKEE